MSLLLELENILRPPFDSNLIMRKQISIRRTLLENAPPPPKYNIRIALLGGSTTTNIKNILEIFLLHEGIIPEFFESDYNKFYEDAIFGNCELDSFKPEIIIIFTTIVNLHYPPELTNFPEEVFKKLENEFSRFKAVWEALRKKYNAIIIQNNFDLPYSQPEGSSQLSSGLGRFVHQLNVMFASYASENSGFYVHDINRLCSEIGLMRWHNRNQFYAYKLAVNYDVSPEIAWSLKRLICAILGRVKKCLVLDLDNTLWGGVIGDDGVRGIIIGNETPQAEAYTEFQRYCKSLKERGIILAVCSKNDIDTAKSGFSHPDSVLKVDDFAAFCANWEPKNINIRQIAKDINIGLDSLVFIDDSPAERAIVRETVSEVSVPEVDANDVFSYIRAIEMNGYFDTVNISDDDRIRSETYSQNSQRAELEQNSKSYDDFLQSLRMKAEVMPFSEVYYDRIAQLTNKTNQFNLTTKRFTLADIRSMSESSKFITLYCRLKDRFGDNGVISVVIAEKDNDNLNIILWLMSCRVLRRGVENLMINCLMNEAERIGCKKVTGFYFKTKKNGITACMYKDFGFRLANQDGEDSTWEIMLEEFRPMKHFINITEGK